VAGAATASCFNNVMSNVTYSSSHRQAGTPITDIQSTLRTAPDFCKIISLAVLLGSVGNSYMLSALQMSIAKLDVVVLVVV